MAPPVCGASRSLVLRARSERSDVGNSGDAAPLVPVVKNEIWSEDKDQSIIHIALTDALLAASESQRRFTMIVFEAFALVALVFSSAGIYGCCRAPSQSEHVRSALGASRGSILGQVIRQDSQGLVF